MGPSLPPKGPTQRCLLSLLLKIFPPLQVVYTVTQNCRQTVIDIVEDEWHGEKEENPSENKETSEKSEIDKNETEDKEKSEVEQSQPLGGRPSLDSMEATVQRVGE